MQISWGCDVLKVEQQYCFVGLLETFGHTVVLEAVFCVCMFSLYVKAIGMPIL